MNILYTIGCPKCKILEQKLNEKSIKYEVCTDVKFMLNKGIKSVPMLEIDDERILNYIESINWIKEQNNE